MATLATLLRSGGAGQVATYTHVYVFVSLAAVGAGLTGTRAGAPSRGDGGERAGDPTGGGGTGGVRRSTR